MRRSALALAYAAAALGCNALLGIEAGVLEPADGGADGPRTPDATADGSSALPAPEAGADGCAGGACSSACDAGLTECNGTCIDVRSNDARNCGACGHSCLAGQCLGGVCQPFDVARQQSNVGAIALDDDDVYWSGDDGTTATLGRAPKSGAAPCVGVAAACTVHPVNPLGSLAVSSGYVYATDIAAGTIVRYALGLAGGPATMVATAGTPVALLPMGSRIYWTNRGLEFVRSAPLAGGNVVAHATATAATPSPWGLATDGTKLFVAASSTGTGTGALEPGLYRIDPTAPCTGAACGPARVTSDNPFEVTIADGWVYWTSLGGRLYRELLTGGCGVGATCPEVLATVPMAIRGVAVDGSAVYFTSDDGTLRRARVGTSCTNTGCAVVAGGLGLPATIVQDARAIYWVRYEPGVPASGAVTGLAK